MQALFLGDLSPIPANETLFQNGSIDDLFTDTISLFNGNDINFVNLECAVTDCDKPIKKFGPPLKTGIKTAETLKKLGVNYCGLSNNHVFDFGIRGANDTLAALTEAGIRYTGFGASYADSRKNLVIEKDGERVCIIAVCEHEYSYALEDRMGCRGYDEYDTQEDIRSAKKENDRVIVIYHGGKEHCRYPSPRLRKLCRAMAKNGADVVLCQHSHCVGCYEEYQGTHILYGQGNFHFVGLEGTPVPETWNGSLAAKYNTKDNLIEFVPLMNYNDCGIALAKGEFKEKLMSGFEKRNAELKNGEWKKGWHEFCLSVREVYTNVVKTAGHSVPAESAYDLFGHFLDCEAHTDVWRELFPTYNQTNEK